MILFEISILILCRYLYYYVDTLQDCGIYLNFNEFSVIRKKLKIIFTNRKIYN